MNDDITQLFQDSQSALDEMPSALTWDRLEQKLDEKEERKKGFVLRKFAVAAAVIIALSLVGLWTFINPMRDTSSADVPYFQEKQLASELVASDAPAPSKPILMSHPERNNFLATGSYHVNKAPILAENKTTHTSTATITEQATQKNVQEPLIAENNISNAKKILPQSVDKEAITKDVITPETLTSSEVVTSIKEVVATPTITEKPEKIPSIASADAAIEYKEIEESIALEEVEISREMLPMTSAAKSTMPRPATPQRKQEEAATMAVEAEADSEIPSAIGIDKFDWLLGQWADENDDTYETWQRNADTIVGLSYRIVNVDTLKTQSMKIVQTGKEVYLMSNGKVVSGAFQLEGIFDSKAVFSNQEQQVTLEHKVANKFTMTVDKELPKRAKKKDKKKKWIRRFRRVQ